MFATKNYLSSARCYELALASNRGKPFLNDYYKSARSWALANLNDSAFIDLELLVYKYRYSAFRRMESDSSFSLLKPSTRWQRLIDTAKIIYERNEAKGKALARLFEPRLAARLDSLFRLDQMYRLLLDTVEKHYGKNSAEVKQIWMKITYQDSMNLIEVKKILDTRGWLGPEILHGGSTTLFLIIQHADLETQTHYLPMFRQAVKDNKLDPGSLAMLEDRVLLRKGQLQLYGTQIRRDSVSGKYFVAPLKDPFNVDKRRAEIGLGAIADYVSAWDIDWDPAAIPAPKKRKP